MPTDFETQFAFLLHSHTLAFFSQVETPVSVIDFYGRWETLSIDSTVTKQIKSLYMCSSIKSSYTAISRKNVDTPYGSKNIACLVLHLKLEVELPLSVRYLLESSETTLLRIQLKKHHLLSTFHSKKGLQQKTTCNAKTKTLSTFGQFSLDRKRIQHLTTHRNFSALLYLS